MWIMNPLTKNFTSRSLPWRCDSLAMNEALCKSVARKCMDKSRSPGQEKWHNLFTKVEEYLLETSIKKRLPIVDGLLKDISMLRSEDFSCHDDNEFLPSLIGLSCTIYVCSLSNLKLCQRVKKILNVLHKANPQVLKSEIKRNIEDLLSSPENQLTLALEKVCQLIGDLELGRECLDVELFVKFFLAVSLCLDSFCQQCFGQDGVSCMRLNSSEHWQIKTIIKASLEAFQYFPMQAYHLLYNELVLVTYDNIFEAVESLIRNLFTILFCKTLPKECLFLCGTAVGLLLAVTVNHKSSAPAREIVAQLLVAAGSTSIEWHSVSVESLVVGPIRVSLPVSEYSAIIQLAIIMGILKSQKDELLLAIDSETRLPHVPEGGDCTVTEGLLFHSIYSLCRENKNSQVHYITLDAMREWLLWVLHSVKQKCFIWITSSDSYHTRLLLELVWDNLDFSVDGVPTLAIKLFSLLLELHKEEATSNTGTDGQFHSTLIEKTIGLPWHLKGRYGLICCLLPFVGLQKVMENQPSLLDDLTRCLGVNQLAPSSSSTLRALLECGRCTKFMTVILEYPTCVGLQCQSEFADMWEKVWRAALLKALMSNQRLVQQNACLYWLPCVFKTVPGSFHSILMELKQLFESKVAHVNTTDSNSILAAYIAVLKAGRSLALLKTSELDEDFILQGLNHLQDDIRATALSIISLTTKTAEPLSAVEQRLLKNFLPRSLNTACSSFRQTLFASIKKILGRIRDSSLILLKKHYPFVSQGKPVEQLVANCIVHGELRTMFEFVDWVFNLALGCLFPGSSYQRQKTGVQLLVAAFDVFAAKWQPNKKKGQPPVACQVLVLLAEYFGYFPFFSPRSGAILCGCIESPYCDVRDSAVQLLLEHFPWPVLLSESDRCGTTSASLLIHKALNLVRSPKVQDCESGAALFQLIHSKYVLELGCLVGISTEEIKISLPDSRPSDGDTLSCVVGLFQQLLSELQDHVTASQKDLRAASHRRPGHGLSLAIARILQVTLCRMGSEGADLQGLESWHRFKCAVQQTVDTAVEIIRFMVEVLGGSQDTNTVCGASYAVIGETLNGLLSSSLTLRDEACGPHSVQSQGEFVMSFCWLHVKCACYLLAVILEAAVQLETASEKTAGPMTLVTEDALRLIGETAKGVIVQCRHQGVVLNCRSSFVMICRSLFHSKRPSLQQLPKRWLDQMLTTISSPASLTSVTRRSAGLPVLFACVLSSEPSVGQRPLLKHCMESLVKTADLPIPCVIDDHKDLPQVHAINILKALYQETSLGSAVLEFATQGTIVAVTGFASPSWAVRNASLQLYGSVVNRIVGHRRGTDSDSEMNTISARDFFNSYPALYEFFLKHLKGASDSGSSNGLPTQSVKPELFPILTLLSKLHPSSEAEERSSGLFLDLVPHITSLSSCPIYGLRSVASKALIPFIPTERLPDKVQELISLLPGLSQQFSQNFLHGTLLQIRVLLDNVKRPLTNKCGGILLQELLEKTWITTERNPCSLTRASFLSILLDFGPSLATGSESGLQSLEAIILDSIESLDTQTKGPSIGGVHLQRVRVKASLEILFNKPWSTDRRKIQTNEPRAVLSTFLSSPNHEQRLSALQFMCDLQSQEGSSSLSSHIQVDLTNLLIKETDQCCLSFALDAFVKLVNRLENCVLCCDQVRKLWRILQSLACQSCGVSIAGKAIAACSVLLKQVLRLDAKKERTASDQMLSTWCKLVEASCSWNQDKLLRLGAVEGLKLCGVAVLTYALRCGTVKGSERSDMTKVIMSVLRSALCLLQDEEEAIRKTAANFVAVIPASTGLQFRSVTCAAAVERVLQFMVQHLWHSDECWVTMETLIRGEQTVEDVLKDCSRSRQVLFEHEDSNLYAEPVVLAELATKHFKLVVDKVLSSDDDHASVSTTFSRWCLSWFERFAADLHSLACSGMKDYGSFPNPRPFTVRFRVMCLADVLFHVTQCGLQTDTFRKGMNSVTEQLKTVLEQVIKGSSLVHPWLNEYARKLMSAMEQSTHGKV